MDKSKKHQVQLTPDKCKKCWDTCSNKIKQQGIIILNKNKNKNININDINIIDCIIENCLRDCNYHMKSNNNNK